MVAALPANVEFHIHAELTMFPSKHALNIEKIKDLYGLRIHLKQKGAEFETIIGHLCAW